MLLLPFPFYTITDVSVISQLYENQKVMESLFCCSVAVCTVAMLCHYSNVTQ